uniref:Rho-GDI like protein n=1 Tax=Xenopus laevis TaxID=8355 RepID=Q90ZB3_XENLA|nr:Rho-GDI like protein [Xenopus laevis]
MADKDGIKHGEEEVEEEVEPNYKAPEMKSLQEIQELDKDDESLIKYKQALLGQLPAQVDPNAPNVQVTRLTLICDEAPEPITMDLTGDISHLKEKLFILKEGVSYRVKICYKVNKEIVSGLKYVHSTYRRGVKVDAESHMVGSYGPRVEEYEFLTPLEEAPKGLIARGTYGIKSKFTDDDKSDHLSWEWKLAIKKEWKD